MNPFTTGISQSLAALPMFSGAWLRIISFILVYALLMAFLLLRARRNERDGMGKDAGSDDGTESAITGSTIIDPDDSDKETPTPLMPKALRAFIIIFAIGIAMIIACSIVPLPGLSDLVFPVCALTFLVCGIISPLRCGCGFRQLATWFLKGVKAIAPGALLVLMASSISFMLTEGRVLDTIIFYTNGFLAGKPGWVTILGIYLLSMAMNFFIPSGSAKAFLLIPLLVPIVDLAGIPRQLLILAYIFGDGFTNVFYPTNPATLIALSLCGLSYGQWIRNTWRFFLGLLILTSVMLLAGLAIGYR
jgi:uncharacterized ion transporter superfamily protein YfcC